MITIQYYQILINYYSLQNSLNMKQMQLYLQNQNIMQKKSNKQDLLLFCRLAQQTQRYQQMIDYIDQIYKLQGQLSSTERNLCSAGYKNVVGNRRAELRVLNGLQAKQTSKGNQKNMVSTIKKYKEKIQSELTGYCRRILKIIDENLLPNIKSIQAKVFYLKMKGDYNRYLCQFLAENKQINQNNRIKQIAKNSYEEADNLARNNLASTNPIRLGLHLNMSVFYYEILGKIEKALQIANHAFEDSIGNIDNVNEQNYKDCTLIMQLLRDNITLWSNEQRQQEEY